MPCRRGAVHEGTPVAAVRGQGMPTLKTHPQDSVRALASSLSTDGGATGLAVVGSGGDGDGVGTGGPRAAWRRLRVGPGHRRLGA